MLYQGDNPVLKIEAVEYMRWGDGTYRVAPRNYCALAFRIRGTARIESQGGVYTVNTNDVMYLPQDLGYTATYTDTEMIVIHFVTRRSDKRIEVYPMEDAGRIYKLFLRAYALWQNREPGYTVYAMSQLYDILGTILETQTKINLPPHFLQAVSYINANYRTGITMQSICENSGIGGAGICFRAEAVIPRSSSGILRAENLRRPSARSFPRSVPEGREDWPGASWRWT